MIFSEIETEIRHVLEDPDKSNWSSENLWRRIYQVERALMRRMALVDGNYHNSEINLYPDDFTKIGEREFEVRLPKWVHRITVVWRREAASDPVFAARSPYLVRDSSGEIIPEARKAVVPPASAYRTDPGYLLVGNNMLKLVRVTEPEALMVQVAKVPPPLMRGTIDLDAEDFGVFFTQDVATVEAADGTPSNNQDEYKDTLFEFTRASEDGEALETMSGQVRRSVSSDLQVVGSDSKKRIRVALDRDLPFTPKVGDTYETHSTIPDAHIRYLVLKVARDAFLEKGMTTQMGHIDPLLSEEKSEFENLITPRQTQEPKIMRQFTSYSRRPSHDMDVDPHARRIF